VPIPGFRFDGEQLVVLAVSKDQVKDNRRPHDGQARSRMRIQRRQRRYGQ
jgi:hypothetical protein